MSAAAIARYLKDFDAPGEPRPKKASDAAFISPDTAIPLPEPAPPDLAAERAVAFDEGRQVALAEAASTYDEALRLQNERHALALEELTARYEGEVAATFAARFDTLAGTLGESIGAQVAALLAPLVEQAVTGRMVGEFATLVSRTVSEGGTVTVCGPKALFERLAAHPKLAGIDLRHGETEQPDLSIELESTVVATRLAAWTDELREMLT